MRGLCAHTQATGVSDARTAKHVVIQHKRAASVSGVAGQECTPALGDGLGDLHHRRVRPLFPLARDLCAQSLRITRMCVRIVRGARALVRASRVTSRNDRERVALYGARRHGQLFRSEARHVTHVRG